MSLTDLESFLMHYGKTLARWRERFFQHLGEGQALSFDERVQRMWDFYLARCESAFRKKHIHVVQLLLERSALATQPVLTRTRPTARSFLSSLPEIRSRLVATMQPLYCQRPMRYLRFPAGSLVITAIAFILSVEYTH